MRTVPVGINTEHSGWILIRTRSLEALIEAEPKHAAESVNHRALTLQTQS
jgi:hypothetical protein